MHTPSGPRARTLATFRMLTADVLARAAQAATRPFDAGEVRTTAWRAGAPVGESAADQAARTLLAEAAAGRLVAPGLRRLLVDRVGGAGPLPDLASGDSGAEWAGATPEERGRTLRDLLELTDHLPVRRRGALRFPRLTTRARG